MRLIVSAFVLLVLATTAGASSSWPVSLSEGIAGVRLGMTQAQVAARMGKPYAMTLPTGNVRCGLYARIQDFGACFDTRTHRVVSLDAIGPKFCVVRPHFCFQRVGGLAALKRAFGRRLIGPHWSGEAGLFGNDELFYEYLGSRDGRRVQNAFVIDTQGSRPYRGSAVIAVYISFCGWQRGSIPPCPKRRWERG